MHLRRIFLNLLGIDPNTENSSSLRIDDLIKFGNGTSTICSHHLFMKHVSLTPFGHPSSSQMLGPYFQRGSVSINVTFFTRHCVGFSESTAGPYWKNHPALIFTSLIMPIPDFGLVLRGILRPTCRLIEAGFECLLPDFEYYRPFGVCQTSTYTNIPDFAHRIHPIAVFSSLNIRAE